MDDFMTPGEVIAGTMTAASATSEGLCAKGHFGVECFGSDGTLLWSETVGNLVTTLGKNLILDQSLAGSSYTAVEYMGLISGASFSVVAAADTMASHAGWLEASGTNAPSYGTTRPTCAWGAASGGAKAVTPALSFVFTNSGTIQGLFTVGGSGASATVGNTGGTLINAGTLATAQPVISGNTITATYTLTIT